MGGAELGIYEICRHREKRHEVPVPTPRLSRKLSLAYEMEGSEFDMSGFEVTRYTDRLNFKDAPGQGLLKGLIPPFSLSLACRAMRQARSFRPDVVLVFYALPCGLAGARIRKKLGIPVLLSLIGRDVPGPAIPRFWGAYVRWSMRSVDRTLFISEYCRQALGGTGRPAADVIPFGVDPRRFAPGADASSLRERLGIPREAKVLLALQRLDPWKQVGVWIQAQGLLLQQTDAYLVIGGKGPELGSCGAWPGIWGFHPGLFAGYIPDGELPFYYVLADLFVFHSGYETFCLSLLQAMAAGTPVVSVRTILSIIIVNWNTRDLLRECLDSNREISALFPLGNDRRRQRIRRRQPAIHPGRTPWNKADRKQYQSWLLRRQQSGCPFRLGSLAVISQSRHPGPRRNVGRRRLVHAAAPAGRCSTGRRSCCRNGSLQATAFAFPGKLRMFAYVSGLNRFFKLSRFTDHSVQCTPDYVQGSFLIVRREVFEKCGGFDESFFLYAEEIDLCLRVKAAGYAVYYYPGVSITHHGGGSMSDPSAGLGHFIKSSISLYQNIGRRGRGKSFAGR